MLANDRLTFVAENVEQSSPHPWFTEIFRELCVERLAEYFVLDEVVSKVVDWNRVKEVFPSNVLKVGIWERKSSEFEWIWVNVIQIHSNSLKFIQFHSISLKISLKFTQIYSVSLDFTQNFIQIHWNSFNLIRNRVNSSNTNDWSPTWLDT